jgi:hypothetical protein
MSAANKRQEGGQHYQGHAYQHWDFVCDTGLHYLLGCASKYVSRWREKNGLEDLKKAIHYLDKAEERLVGRHGPITYAARHRSWRGWQAYALRYAQQLRNTECEAVLAMCAGDYSLARRLVNELIDSILSPSE